jgi:hypothetical protein
VLYDNSVRKKPASKGEIMGIMNITDKDGLWRLSDGGITSLKTGEFKLIKDLPHADALAYMDYAKYMRKCRVAFETGQWPMTHWASGRETC